MQEKKYPCVFDLTDSCPVRKYFKLEPESLVRFCKICPILHEEIIEAELDIEGEKDDNGCGGCKEREW